MAHQSASMELLLRSSAEAVLGGGSARLHSFRIPLLWPNERTHAAADKTRGTKACLIEWGWPGQERTVWETTALCLAFFFVFYARDCYAQYSAEAHRLTRRLLRLQERDPCPLRRTHTGPANVCVCVCVWPRARGLAAQTLGRKWSVCL